MYDVNLYFNRDGNKKNESETYFDSNGDLINYYEISLIYKNYPNDSDIVRMHYASEFADQTHGNYCAQTLFRRAYC